jgi:rubrerythrin
MANKADTEMRAASQITEAHAIRKCIISEVEADVLYGEISRLSKDDGVIAVMNEIRADEQNHIGRLINLLIELEGEDSSFVENFRAGLEDREKDGSEE